MRVLRAIIGAQAAFVATSHAEMPQTRGVGPELVGHDHRRCEAVSLQQLAHQLHRRSPVAPPLDQYIEDLAFVVDGAPEIHPLAADSDDHLVEMPLAARTRTIGAQTAGEYRPEFENPPS